MSLLPLMLWEITKIFVEILDASYINIPSVIFDIYVICLSLQFSFCKPTVIT